MRLSDEELLDIASSLSGLLKTSIPNRMFFARRVVGNAAMRLREHANSSSKASWSDTKEVR